jgi:hypothetical protein
MSSCSSCNKPFEQNQEKVTTDNGVKFHRDCLEKLLHSKSTTSNQVCEKMLILITALTRIETKSECVGTVIVTHSCALLC